MGYIYLRCNPFFHLDNKSQQYNFYRKLCVYFFVFLIVNFSVSSLFVNDIAPKIDSLSLFPNWWLENWLFI